MIFEVTTAHIEALTDTDLRTLVGYLAEREVVNAGHSASSVTYGGHQNAKDGGIDVRVTLDSGTINGFVPRAACGFQVKAESFGPADITREMLKDGKLRASIRALGEASGAYVIVSSKSSVSDQALATRRNAMEVALANEPSVKSLFTDFYDQRRLASWVNQHPGIIPWVRSRIGDPISGWRPFEDWSSSPGAENSTYILDDGIRLLGANHNSDGLRAEEGIDRLRAILGEPGGVVRLVGLSGVGKTRLVQAVFDERVGVSPLSRHIAVYTDIGDQPDPVPSELLSRLQSLGQRCILIVDNCGAELHRKLAARLSANSKISLVTIDYDISDDESENTDVFKLEPASHEVIEKILKLRFLNLTEPEIRTIAEFSEGNFRIALALANTSRDGQSLANLRDKDLFNRLFRQKNEDNPYLLRAAKICSLVYSFDVETIDGPEAELPLLAALADQSVSEFSGHVAELKRRKLAQMRSKWRALLPHALAHRLAKQALEDLPTVHFKAFMNAVPPRLLTSLSRRLGCLHDFSPAQTIVNDWLAQEGMLYDLGRLNKQGMVLLENIAPTNPEAVLKSIQHAANAHPDFFESNPNADGFVRILRSLAYEALLFGDAIGLIASFANSKTESNNMSDAVNVFKSLFHIYLSGTHASPKQRADFVRNLASTPTEPVDSLVLGALDAMLECSHFSSAYRFEFGTRRRDYGFNPSTLGEQWEWYKQAFLLACDLAMNGSLKTRVRTMIASQFRYLVSRARLDDLTELAEAFADDDGWPEGWAGVKGALREARKAVDEESVAKLAILEEKLCPKSLAHRIVSYALPSQWGALDLADIEFDDENKYEKIRKKVDEACEDIGAELANDLSALRLHLPELLESGSDRVFTVAKAIGRTTSDPDQLWECMEGCLFAPGRNGKIYSFPGGFLLGLSERAWNHADALLDRAAANSKWHPFLPHMQSCVGIDAAGCKRLVATIPSPSLPPFTLRNLAVGRSLDNLNGSDLKTLLLAIMAKEDGFDVAIELLYMRVFSLRSDNKPVTNVERDLAARLLTAVTFEKKKSREPHMLAEMLKHCLRSPEDVDVARTLCKRLVKSFDEYVVSAWDYGELVSEIGGRFPRVILDEIVELAAALGTRRTWDFSERPSHHRPHLLQKIDDIELLNWAHERPETRFTMLAAAIVGWHGSNPRRDHDNAPDEDEVANMMWTPAALRLIHEAPDPIPVLDEFFSRFRPSGWSGSLADILAGREPLLETLVADPDQRIAEWAKKSLPKLREERERCRKVEAKQDRKRDERFDW
jgi:hypothetical protein